MALRHLNLNNSRVGDGQASVGVERARVVDQGWGAQLFSPLSVTCKARLSTDRGKERIPGLRNS